MPMKSNRDVFDQEIHHYYFRSGKPLPNGCRTLLRLHRALAFISAFLNEMRTAPDDASSASIASNAYSATLARFPFMAC